MAETTNVFKENYYINMNLVTKETLLQFKLAGHMLPIVNENDSLDDPKNTSLKNVVLHEFPGNGITGLVNNYRELSKIVADKKNAYMVIEYWDREHKKPVAWLYPTGRICSTSEKLESDMNAETHADLEYEQRLRLSWMNTIKKTK